MKIQVNQSRRRRAVPSAETKPSPESSADLPLCDCGRVVTEPRGCVGCGLHPLDCNCFPVGYDHELAAKTSNVATNTPQVGDYWEFKLPGKRKRTKEVGSIGTKDFIVERGTYPDWKDKTERLPYVNWARENKGRYTGISVRRLLEFGHRVSTKSERDAHLHEMIDRARARDGKKPLTREQKG